MSGRGVEAGCAGGPRRPRGAGCRRRRRRCRGWRRRGRARCFRRFRRVGSRGLTVVVWACGREIPQLIGRLFYPPHLRVITAFFSVGVGVCGGRRTAVGGRWAIVCVGGVGVGPVEQRAQRGLLGRALGRARGRLVVGGRGQGGRLGRLALEGREGGKV